MEQIKTKPVKRTPSYSELTAASMTTSSRHFALLLGLSRLSGRRIVVKHEIGVTGEKRKYALLGPGTKIVNPIIPVSQGVVFWYTLKLDADEVSGMMLFVGDLKWISMREALSELMPVKFDSGKSDRDLIVLEGFKLAPEWLLDNLYSWCLCHEGGRATSEEVLEYILPDVPPFARAI